MGLGADFLSVAETDTFGWDAFMCAGARFMEARWTWRLKFTELDTLRVDNSKMYQPN